MNSAKHIHVRDLSGIKSEQVEDWEGTPLAGTYLLKNTLADQGRHASYGPPLVLVPGAWDPKEGEYSEALIRRLLEEERASAVYELHFCYEGQDGYDEPDTVVADLQMMSQGEARPVFVSLCAGGILSLESVLRVVEITKTPSISGVFSIGPGVGYLNRLGKFMIYSITNKKVKSVAKHLVYSGHDHTLGNAQRHYDFWFTTRITEALKAVDTAVPVKGGYPVEVEVLYFQHDLVSREGRARLRRVFQMEHRHDHLKGSHGALRNNPLADEHIALYYRKVAAREAARVVEVAPVESAVKVEALAPAPAQS